MKSCEKQDEERHTILRGYFNMCVAYYVHLLKEPEYILEAPVRRDIRIGDYRVAHFIDCNCLETSVAEGGPAESGTGAARWDDTIQRSFYNGWKSVHGLKHQTVNNAFGFTVDIAGPTSLRRNDLQVLRSSEINERMAALQELNDIQYIIFGDSAYKRLSHLMSYLNADEDIANYHAW
eukprot:CAMPEP_0170448640 /NCGR_PEP_ID=MMETSP0117_2-20130122/50821_1 /TAXON_ID=400756 /ORGANISM="Durinskia baltica, Strain CSIRO CS-38" /LENGTH=177 /DNA_ID=CAMNT_0010709833 /DNA_START=158 /DNA_END=688 /DNA_ORIENTATION=+